jgi:hypothetical protein
MKLDMVEVSCIAINGPQRWSSFDLNTSFGKSQRKMPLGRLRYKWEKSLKMDLTEIGYKCVN